MKNIRNQFDMELRVMITVYIERMKDENRTSKEKLTEKTKISEAIDELRESIGPYNTWLMELHTPESGNLTEDIKNRWVRFIELFDIIGILDDLQQYYHNEDTMIDDLKGPIRLLCTYKATQPYQLPPPSGKVLSRH